MDPEMMAAMGTMPPPDMPPPDMAAPPMAPPSPMAPPPPEMVTGPMAAMQEPDMQGGGDSLAALMQYADDPEVRRLLEEQDIQRKMMAAQMQAESLMAAEAIMQKMRSFGDSIDMPGGQF